MISETGYAIVSVSEPQEAVELVEENFPVHEKSKGEVDVYAEYTSEAPPQTEVEDLLKDNTIESYSLFSRPVNKQSELPEELRDPEQVKEESKAAKPETGKISEDEAESIIKILRNIKKEETDGDHVRTLEKGEERVREICDEEISVDNVDFINEKDIIEAMDSMKREGVKYSLNDHPNNILLYAREFIEIYEDRLPL